MDEDQHVVGVEWLVRCWGDAAGTCNHLNNAYAALCRCAGIKARILNFNVQFGDLAQFYDADIILSSFMNRRKYRDSRKQRSKLTARGRLLTSAT